MPIPRRPANLPAIRIPITGRPRDPRPGPAVATALEQALPENLATARPKPTAPSPETAEIRETATAATIRAMETPAIAAGPGGRVRRRRLRRRRLRRPRRNRQQIRKRKRQRHRLRRRPIGQRRVRRPRPRHRRRPIRPACRHPVVAVAVAAAGVPSRFRRVDRNCRLRCGSRLPPNHPCSTPSRASAQRPRNCRCRRSPCPSSSRLWALELEAAVEPVRLLHRC